ncbi:MAG: hypothetical protein HC902_14950 [Calothrix sp. SM1_5_4]|nr:hypothetical protein [Calothrix sp. SM1_5_4]
MISLLSPMAHAGKGFNYEDPFGPKQLAREYCVLDLRAPAMRTVEALGEYYDVSAKRLAAYMADAGHREGVFKVMQPGRCPEVSLKIVVTADVALRLRTLIPKGEYQIIGDFTPSYAPPASAEFRAMYARFERAFRTLSARLIAGESAAEIEKDGMKLDLRLWDKNEVGSVFRTTRELDLLTALRNENLAYERIRALLASASPLGFEEIMADLSARPELAKAGKGDLRRLALIRVISMISDMLGEPYLFSHTYDAMSFASMIALKEMEERAPLNEVVATVNEHFVYRALAQFRRYRQARLGYESWEFLTYLQRYAPHLHPYLHLSVSAILADAGFSESRAPSPKDIEAYHRLPKEVIMIERPDLPTGHRWPYLLTRIAEKAALTYIHEDLMYFERWLRRHQVLPMVDWRQLPAGDVRQVADRTSKKRQKPLDYSDCSGFLTARKSQ